METQLTPLKAIRARCLDCCCGQVSEVRHCAVVNCSLHPYRMGHRPTRIEDTGAESQDRA